MLLPLNRREFLSQGLIAGGAVLAAEGMSSLALAAKPITRTDKSHFKLSLAAYSFRNSFTAKAKPLTMNGLLDLCAQYDLDGCELTSYWFPEQITPAYLNGLKEQAFRLGLDISGTAIRNDFCLPEGEERQKWLQHTRTWIDHAAVMGAPVIRIFAGNVPKDSTEEQARERCVAGIRESLAYAAEKGVALALENHGGITSTPEQLLAIVEQIDSPWFGINFDSGNFHSADPYADLGKIAPYAINAQIKTEMSHDGKQTDADLARIVEILKESRYRGYLVLEYEAAEDPFAAVPRHLDALRKLLGR